MEKARYIKTIVFTSLNDVGNIEENVNAVIQKICKCGGKIVSIVPHNFGFSPMNLIYDIIYENTAVLTDKELNDEK